MPGPEHRRGGDSGFTPAPEDEARKGPGASLGDFWALIAGTRPSLPALAVALCLSAASTVGGLFVPMFTKSLVDGFSLSAVGAGKVAMIIAAFVVQAGAGALSGYLLARVGQGVVASLRERLWRKELALPVASFDEKGSGALVSRMTNDTAVVKGFITDNLAGLASGVISIVGALGFLFYLNWKMTLIMLSPCRSPAWPWCPWAHDVAGRAAHDGRERALHGHPVAGALGDQARQGLERRGQGVRGRQRGDRPPPGLRRARGSAHVPRTASRCPS